ncbi:MAG: TonB-dependent receptor plug domain-containing protein [Bacteroidales bacterium]|nr:TonB-dependent receptor plug domain-containing protein [Bacteroidales bacterium]
MRKNYFLFVCGVIPIWLLSQTVDSLRVESSEEEITTIVLTASSLDNDDQAQDISGLLQSSDDIFVSTAGYTFGQTRFNIRGYETEYSAVMINGVPLNDMETGRAYWSSWGGLNDATRNKEIETGISKSRYSFGGVGGATNMVTRASSFAKGVKFTYSLTNRSYRNRLMLTASTGLMENGWAFTFSGSRRWAQEGYVDGTFYDAWAYFLSAEKKINSKHSIGLIGFAAPSKRGRNGVATQENYDLAGTNYYNPYWGYQNGEKRNARVANYHQPMIIFSHFWTPSSATSITSSAYYAFGRGGSTALEWDTYSDPRPDYYKRLPSYDAEYEGLMPEEREELWLNDENYRQIKWDELYDFNRKNLDVVKDVNGIEGNTVSGVRSNYIIEDRRNDKSQLGINSNLKHILNDNIILSGGIDLSLYKGYQFKVIDDLLGGEYYVDYDKFAERDFRDSVLMQNDLNVPNHVVMEGDKFGYDYTANINDYKLFIQSEFVYGKVEYFIGGTLSYNEFWRTGHMRNGKFPEDSYGDSEKQKFFNYGLKGGVLYKLTGRHLASVNLLYMTKAPSFRNSYVSPRTRQDVLDNLNNEKIMSADASYIFRSPYIKSRLTVFYTKFIDQVYLRSFYHEDLRSFINYQMTGVDKLNYGLELGIEAKVSQTLTLIGVVAHGVYIYDSRPEITISADNVAEVISNRTAYLKNYRDGGFPQTALSGGVKYFYNYLFAGFNVNYYDNVYIEINPDRRTIDGAGNYDPDYPERDEILKQEKLKPAATLDAYIGKSWKIQDYYISLNFSVSNILNTTDFAFGGFEQYRYDPFDLDRFPNKYFYLYGRQYFLNINFRF